MKGFANVEYLGFERTYTDTVTTERLRIKNTGPPITAATFHKYEVNVPEKFSQ